MANFAVGRSCLESVNGRFTRLSPLEAYTMNLTKTQLDLTPFIQFMETHEAEAILLNHMVISDPMPDSATCSNLNALESFCVQYEGFVEVEFLLSPDRVSVSYIVIRQAPMTLEELDINGEVLPNLTVNCAALSDLERSRLNDLAGKYVMEGSLRDDKRVKHLISQYLAKMWFNEHRFGEIRHA